MVLIGMSPVYRHGNQPCIWSGWPTLGQAQSPTCAHVFPRTPLLSTPRPSSITHQAATLPFMHWRSKGKIPPFIGNGDRGHYERGLFTGGNSRISKILNFSRISRQWSEYSCFPRSGNSLESLKMDTIEKTPFPKDPFFRSRF